MAARQYIGARYVPKFYENSDGTSNWKSGVAYEPLTIVLYNGNSYTSKKTVPASIGNPSLNPSYWASTGIYDQQVEEFRQETLKREYNLENRRIILISDSYGDISTDFSGSTWFTTFISDATAAGVNINNIFSNAIRGASFVRTGYQYETVLYNIRDGVTDKDTITDIIIGGGYNDVVTYRPDYYDQSILTGATAFMNYVKATYPNAKVTFMYMGNATGGNTRLRQRRNMNDLQTSLESVGMKYIYGVNTALMYNGAQLPDGVHPSASGQIALGHAAFNAFVNGTASVFYSWEAAASEVTASTNVTITPATGTIIYESCNGNVKNISIPDIVISFGSNIDLPTLQAPLAVGTLSGTFLIKNMLSLAGALRSAGRSTFRRNGLYYNCTFILWIDGDGVMKLAADAIDYKVYTDSSQADNVSEIHIRNLAGTFDAMTC